VSNPFNRKAKSEELLHDLKVAVLGRMIGFAADVAEEIDSFAARQLFGLSSEGPSYDRQFFAQCTLQAVLSSKMPISMQL
jgi:hypothetical protein